MVNTVNAALEIVGYAADSWLGLWLIVPVALIGQVVTEVCYGAIKLVRH